MRMAEIDLTEWDEGRRRKTNKQKKASGEHVREGKYRQLLRTKRTNRERTCCFGQLCLTDVTNR